MSPILRNLQSGDIVPLDPHAPLIIGRSVEAGLRVASPSVARRHARVEARPKDAGGVEYWALDYGSTNGTLVNDQHIGQEGVRLQLGDVIRIADTVVFAFDDDAAPAPPWSPFSSIRIDPPEAVARDAAREILGERESGYRGAGAGHAASGGRRGGPGARGALLALARLDEGDVAGALESILEGIDEGGAPGPLYTHVARALMAISGARAGRVLRDRAFAMLRAGRDATPYAVLLAESGDDPSMFDLRNHAGALRDAGDPRGARIISSLRETKRSATVNLCCDYLHPATEDPRESLSHEALAARVAEALRAPPRADEGALVKALIATLRATPLSDLDKRAALRRLLEDLTGATREAWLASRR